jgi:hypothetical protein
MTLPPSLLNRSLTYLALAHSERAASLFYLQVLGRRLGRVGAQGSTLRLAVAFGRYLLPPSRCRRSCAFSADSVLSRRACVLFRRAVGFGEGVGSCRKPGLSSRIMRVKMACRARL